MLVKNQACSRIKEHGELATFNRFYMSSMFISPITTMPSYFWSVHYIIWCKIFNQPDSTTKETI